MLEPIFYQENMSRKKISQIGQWPNRLYDPVSVQSVDETLIR